MRKMNVSKLWENHMKETWEKITYQWFKKRLEKFGTWKFDKNKSYISRKRKVSLEKVREAYLEYGAGAHKYLWVTRQLVSYYMRQIKKKWIDFNNK